MSYSLRGRIVCVLLRFLLWALGLSCLSGRLAGLVGGGHALSVSAFALGVRISSAFVVILKVSQVRRGVGRFSKG